MRIGEEYTIHYNMGVENVTITGIRDSLFGKIVYFSGVGSYEKYLYAWSFKYRIIKKTE